MQKIILVISVFLLLVMACGTNRQTGNEDCATTDCHQQQAYDRVMATHDAVMPKLADIRRLQQSIEARMAATTDSLAVAEWDSLYRQLTTADAAMWRWMRQFKGDLTEVPPAEALAYLQAEQAKIDSVAASINAAITAAEEKLMQVE